LARWRVLLVDENDDYLDGIAAWLAKMPGIEVVGRAHSGLDAKHRVATLAPDLVLADVSLPDMSGFSLTSDLKAMRPAPTVLLMAFHDSRAVVLAAFAAGAAGCVSKTEVTEHLLPAIASLLGAKLPGVDVRSTPDQGITENDPSDWKGKRREP
jgi:DNA-binding NarL/FixJ family response regulator